MYLLRCPKPGQREGSGLTNEKLFMWWFVMCVTLWSRQHLVLSNESDSVRVTGSHLSPGSQGGVTSEATGPGLSAEVRLSPGMLQSLPRPLIEEGRTLWVEHVGYVVPKALLGLGRETSCWAEWPLWVWCPQLWLLSRRRPDLESGTGSKPRGVSMLVSSWPCRTRCFGAWPGVSSHYQVVLRPCRVPLCLWAGTELFPRLRQHQALLAQALGERSVTWALDLCLPGGGRGL